MKYLNQFKTNVFKTAIVLLLPLLLTGCCPYQLFPGGQHHCSNLDLEDLVKAGRYQEAFKQLDPKGLEDASYDYKVTYDILNVLVNGRSIRKEELYIYPTYQKYPESYAWTMLSAKVLLIYLETGKVDTKAIQDLEDFLKKYYPNRLFWIKALKDLDKTKASQASHP